MPIFDAFGPTLTDPTIDTLVVSQETSSGGDLGNSFFIRIIPLIFWYYLTVNVKRAEKGYSSLEIITVEVISASQNKSDREMLDAKVSSTAIREILSQKHVTDEDWTTFLSLYSRTSPSI